MRFWYPMSGSKIPTMPTCPWDWRLATQKSSSLSDFHTFNDTRIGYSLTKFWMTKGEANWTRYVIVVKEISSKIETKFSTKWHTIVINSCQWISPPLHRKSALSPSLWSQMYCLDWFLRVNEPINQIWYYLFDLRRLISVIILLKLRT